MRFINLNNIKIKIKRIKWQDVNKKHLEDLVYTDPKSGEKYISWLDIMKRHNENIKGLTKEKRSKYFTSNPDWNILQRIMIEEFGYKCWYSEAPIGNGEFEIDHFRPKNRAKQDDNSKTINKSDGYWWLAYDCENYRLSGTQSNKRRRDKLRDNSETEGKGDIFPLDLINGKIADDEKSIFCEMPLLLDPIVSNDVGLLTFDEGGSILPNPMAIDDFDKKRAEISIKLYHLDSDQLETARCQVWSICSKVIEDAYTYFTESDSKEVKKLALKTCAETIIERMNPKSEFSAVAKVCVNTYRKRKGYCDIIEILGL